MSPALTSLQRTVMLHALGLDRSKTSTRNYFVTGPGSADFTAWRSLCELGFATERPYPLAPNDSVFTVSDVGRDALGLVHG